MSKAYYLLTLSSLYLLHHLHIGGELGDVAELVGGEPFGGFVFEECHG